MSSVANCSRACSRPPHQQGWRWFGVAPFADDVVFEREAQSELVGSRKLYAETIGGICWSGRWTPSWWRLVQVHLKPICFFGAWKLDAGTGPNTQQPKRQLAITPRCAHTNARIMRFSFRYDRARRAIVRFCSIHCWSSVHH